MYGRGRTVVWKVVLDTVKHIPESGVSTGCLTHSLTLDHELWAGSPPKKLATLAVEVDCDAQASRLRAVLLIYHFSTSYQATISGVAYRDHGKVAVGRSEGAPSPSEA